MSALTHFDETGASRMVDVGDKGVTRRIARAEGWVEMEPETLRTILDRRVAKGDVLEIARIAGIMASKETSRLIPLCHPLALSSVRIELSPVDDRRLRIESCVQMDGQTGVEMEALTAVSVTALTVYDMCKAIDRGMTLGPFRLLEKSGGKSGHFLRQSAVESVAETSSQIADHG
ncbi:MAG: cyclic pyranopterin monophosphate synthase MoaC [Planctomycetaceae bacterium]